MYITLLFIVYTLPISILNKPYRDDYDRIIKNYLGWSDNGRPLADLVIDSLIAGGPIISFGVFSCIIASLIMALTCCIYCTYIRKDKSIKALLPLIAFYSSPFFIQFLYYKLDSITILLSIAVLFAPFLIKDKNKGVLFNISAMICAIISLSLYQASFPVFLALLAVRAQHDDFNLAKTIASILSFFSGVVVYKVIISSYFISGVYSEESSRLLSPLNKGFIGNYIDNVSKVWGVVKLINSYSVAASLLIAVLIVAFWLLKNFKKETHRSSKMILTISSAIGSAFLFFLQERVTTEPRSLIYVSCIMLLFLALVNTLYLSRLSTIICSVTIICFVNIYLHVNYAREEQFRYEQSVMQMINNIADNNSDKKIFVYGWSAPKNVLSVYDTTPLSIKIANPDFGSWYFSQYLEFYNARKNIFRGGSSTFTIECKNLREKYNGFYTTENKGNNISVYLRNIECI